MKLQAVNIQTESEYNKAIEVLTGMGFKPFQIKESFRKCYLTIEPRYMQLARDSKMLTDKGYETISFEEFINPPKTHKYQLPKEFATKWVEALRSGKYKQDCDHAQYRYYGCYCAIGVAGVANNLPFASDNHIVVNGKDINSFLGFGLFRDVYGLNDLQEKSFPEIADWLIENVEFVESEATHE